MQFPILNHDFYYVGLYPQRNSRSIIFINGILNSYRNAIKSATSVANRIQERVICFRNTTLDNDTSQSVLIDKLGQLIFREHKNHKHFEDLAYRRSFLHDLERQHKNSTTWPYLMFVLLVAT